MTSALRLPVHSVPRADFDALAAGEGTAGGVLWAGQLSKRQALVRTLVDTAAARAPAAHANARLAEGYRTLAAVQAEHRSAVDDLLLLPQIGGWAMGCLRRLLGSRAPDPASAPMAADLGHLWGIVAAEAVRTASDAEVSLPAAAGRFMLPGHGLAILDDHGEAGSDGRREEAGPWVRVRIRAGKPELVATRSGSGSTATAWQPVRELCSEVDGLSIRVHLDDVDPYRGFDGLRPADRLAAGAVAAWQERLDEAWLVLVRHHRRRAEAIAETVRSLVPLDPPGENEELSASCAEAFGAVSLTLPGTGLGLAAALVHEMQHSKLSALLDLVPLHDARPERELYAPWRVDPRPLGGLFQGTYAYLGLTDFWHQQRRLVDGPARRVADFEVARWRGQVQAAIDTLAASSGLTPAGRRFVAGMATRLRRIPLGEVPATERQLAADAVADHRIGWRLRNLRPDPGDVSAWVDAWLAGRPFPGPTAAAAIVSEDRPRFGANLRLSLTYLRLREPARFAELARDPVRLAAAVAADAPDAAVGDALYVAGDPARAAGAYLARLDQDPTVADQWTGLDQWAGLALARWKIASADLGSADLGSADLGSAGIGRDPLVSHPERVLALHREIGARTGTSPDPVALATWLAAAPDPAGRRGRRGPSER